MLISSLFLQTRMVKVTRRFIPSLNVSTSSLGTKKNIAAIILYTIQIECFIGFVAASNLSNVSSISDKKFAQTPWKETAPHHDQRNNLVLLSTRHEQDQSSNIPEIPSSSSSAPSMSSPFQCSSDELNSNCSTDATVSSNSTLAYTPWQATLIGISAGLLSVVTIAGNLMVMISFKMDKQLQTISNYFLFSLAVADMIVGLCSMPLFAAYLIHRSWPYGAVLCDAWLSIDYLASQTSVLNLLVIRYIILFWKIGEII